MPVLELQLMLMIVLGMLAVVFTFWGHLHELPYSAERLGGMFSHPHPLSPSHWTDLAVLAGLSLSLSLSLAGIAWVARWRDVRACHRGSFVQHGTPVWRAAAWALTLWTVRQTAALSPSFDLDDWVGSGQVLTVVSVIAGLWALLTMASHWRWAAPLRRWQRHRLAQAGRPVRASLPQQSVSVGVTPRRPNAQGWDGGRCWALAPGQEVLVVHTTDASNARLVHPKGWHAKNKWAWAKVYVPAQQRWGYLALEALAVLEWHGPSVPWWRLRH